MHQTQRCAWRTCANVSLRYPPFYIPKKEGLFHKTLTLSGEMLKMLNLPFWQHFLGPGLRIPETGLWDDPPQKVCLRSALLTKEVLGAGLSQDCALSVTDPSQKAISELFVRQVQVPTFAVTFLLLNQHVLLPGGMLKKLKILNV